MKRPGARREVQQEPEQAIIELPLGTPDWITAELVELTIEVWQPHYKCEITINEAITILRNAGDMLRVLARR